MKLSIIALAALAGASLLLSGCANSTTGGSTATRDNATTKRSYTQEDLRKTGRSETGAALEASDPAVRTSGGR